MLVNFEEALQYIREIPISSIVGQYQSLKRQGANFVGVCPFHADKNPSMVVSDEKRIFKCFSCQATGDSIRYVMDYLNKDFKDVVHLIAEQNSIYIEQATKVSPEIKNASRCLEYAQKIYEKLANEKHLEEFENFLKNRKISKETAKKFGLGITDQAHTLTALFSELSQQKKIDFSALDLALKIGLIKKSHRAGAFQHYDFFRQRIMIPIYNESGHVRGFTGRALEKDQVPKYLNSSESFIFDKRNILYGMNFAKRSMRSEDRAILVEGHMDVIALHQHGISYSVATQGIALSEKALSKVLNITKNIYLGLDSDQAGQQAKNKINLLCLNHGIIAKDLNYSPYKDADELLVHEGRIELLNRIDNARAYIDLIIDDYIEQELKKGTNSSIEQKLSTMQWIFDQLSPLGESLEAKERLYLYAKRVGLQSSPEDLLKLYLEHIKKPLQGTSKKAAVQFQAQVDKKSESPHSSHDFSAQTGTELQNNQHRPSIKPAKKPSMSQEQVESSLSTEIKDEIRWLAGAVCQYTLLPKLQVEIEEVLDHLRDFDIKRNFENIFDLLRDNDLSNSEIKSQIIFELSKIQSPLLRSLLLGPLSNSDPNPSDTNQNLDKLVFDFKKKFKLFQLYREKKLLTQELVQKEDDESIMTQITHINNKIQELRTKRYNQRSLKS